MDSRIGPSFLKASVGFGGSCFKKDILNLVYISRHYGLNEVADYWEAVVKINNYQTERIGEAIISSLDLEEMNPITTILGWAFKKDTNDSRESASIYLANKLLKNNITLHIYDPRVTEYIIRKDIVNVLKETNVSEKEIELIMTRVKVFYNPYDSIDDSSVVALGMG